MRKGRSRPFHALALSLLLTLPLSLPGLAVSAPRTALPEVVPAPFVYDRPLPLSLPEPNWFADALFLGDSRVEGLRELGSIEAGLWLTQVGLNVRAARTESYAVEGQNLPLAQALEGKRFSKVYLCLGVNEAAWMPEADFYAEYAGLIDDLRLLLPNAQIYVQTIIPVTMSRAAARAPDNGLLAQRNALLARLCREKQVFLVDVASAFTGANGALTQSLSADGLHLNETGNQLLAQYLTTHIFGT